MFYSYGRCHLNPKKHMIELVNEGILVLLAYHTFCFSHFTSMAIQYVVGNSFVATTGTVVLFNIRYMLSNKARETKLKKIKAAN